MKRKETKRIYTESHGDWYNFTISIMSHGYKNPCRKRNHEMLMNCLCREECRSFLDIGFGPGIHLDYMSTRTNLAVGIELSRELVKTVKNHYKENNVEYIVADAENLPFREWKFNFILCSHVLEHLPDVEKAINEIRRVITPHGKAVIALPNLSELIPVWVTLERFGLDPIKVGQQVAKWLRIDPKVIEQCVLNHPQKKTPHEWRTAFQNASFNVEMRCVLLGPFGSTLRFYENKRVYGLISLLDKTIGRFFPFNMFGSGVLLQLSK